MIIERKSEKGTRMPRMSVGWLVLVCTLFGLVVTAPAPAALAASDAFFRVVQASPDAPALDVYVDGQKTIAGLAFEATSGYAAVSSGVHTIRMLPANAASSARALIDTTATMAPGHAYTIVAADVVSKMVPLVLTDAATVAPAGKAVVRVIHSSPDAPALADIAVAGGPVVFRNLPFKGATAYLAVDPGTYRFEVRPAGSTLALATTGPLTVAAGHTYSIFAVGLLANDTFRVLALPDNAASGGVENAPNGGGGGMARRQELVTWAEIAGLLGLALVTGIGAVRRTVDQTQTP